MNMYAYCGNEPINHKDPLGLATVWGYYYDGTKMWALVNVQEGGVGWSDQGVKCWTGHCSGGIARYYVFGAWLYVSTDGIGFGSSSSCCGPGAHISGASDVSAKDASTILGMPRGNPVPKYTWGNKFHFGQCAMRCLTGAGLMPDILSLREKSWFEVANDRVTDWVKDKIKDAILGPLEGAKGIRTRSRAAACLEHCKMELAASITAGGSSGYDADYVTWDPWKRDPWGSCTIGD